MSCGGGSSDSGNGGGCCSPCMACIPQCPKPRCLNRRKIKLPGWRLIQIPQCPPCCEIGIKPVSNCPCPVRPKCPMPCTYCCTPCVVGPCRPPPCPCPQPQQNCGEEEESCQDQNGGGNGGGEGESWDPTEGGYEVIVTKDACGSRVRYGIDPCGQVCRQVENCGNILQSPCANGVFLEADGGCSPCGDCFVNVRSICCPCPGDPCCIPSKCPIPAPPCGPRCRVICDPQPYQCPSPCAKVKTRYEL